MISTENLGLSFGSNKLFAGVNIKFLPGNCYGLIGANGSGKSTFLKILSGEITNFSGNVNITPVSASPLSSRITLPMKILRFCRSFSWATLSYMP